MDWQAAALEEYRALRAESLDSMKTQHLMTHIGATAVGLTLAWGFHQWDRSLLPDLIFLVFAPAMCYVLLIVWVGEVARLMRVGLYLAEKERAISASFPSHPDAMNWENWLRAGKGGNHPHQLRLNYLAIIVLFLASAIAAVAIGNFRMIGALSLSSLVLLDVFEIFACLATSLYIYRLGRKFKKS